MVASLDRKASTLYLRSSYQLGRLGPITHGSVGCSGPQLPWQPVALSCDSLVLVDEPHQPVYEIQHPPWRASSSANSRYGLW